MLSAVRRLSGALPRVAQQANGLTWQPVGSIFSHCANFSTSKDPPPDSHDDFKPKIKAPEETLPVYEAIEKDIKSHSVMVYMKGVPAAPQCGFSSMVCQILDAHDVPFVSRNVLEDEELRQGIKTFSNWPTIPQVYINGEFVGGCNILIDMHKSGELTNKLKDIKGK